MASVNMASVACLLLIYCGLSMVSACVPPTCVYVEHKPDSVWDLNNPWLITIIALSSFFFFIILLVLLWFCCYCCYRDNVATAPRIIRRIVRVRTPVQKVEEPRPEPRVVHHVMSPPAPPPPPPVCFPAQYACPMPPEKVVVVPPAVPEPATSLLLTVSEGLRAGNAGPDMTTRVDKPLTFTLTPQTDGIRYSGLRTHKHY